ncbi:MAG TPA: MFS transporter [Candidatus Sulfomarinibacteraceae bacterium]|nr:MFS transporter [Candidatus Sulfomarinibacteraceae bacterium]
MDDQRSMKQFLLIWAGQAMSLLGSRLVHFALIWWLTKETESATMLALASLVGLLPELALGPLAGVLVDRWNRRRVMIAADALVALSTLLLGYLFWIGAAQIGHVLGILFLRSLGGAFHWPAMQASMTMMVPEKHFTRFQGLNQTLNGALSVAAAPLGAILLELLPMQGIIAIDVATALFAILPLLFIDIPQPSRQTASGAQLASVWIDLADGLSYVRSRRGLVILICMAVVINLVLNPTFSLLPLLVRVHFEGGALQLGWLESASGLGLVLGGMVLTTWGGFRRRIFTSQLGIFGLGLSVLVVGLTPATGLPLAIGALFVTGLSMGLANGPIFAIVQATVKPEIQGRVFTLLTSLVTAMTPVGLLVAGPLADRFGVQLWYLIGGAITMTVAVAGFFSPSLINIEEEGKAQVEDVPAAAVSPLAGRSEVG